MIVASDLEGTVTTGTSLRGIGRYLVRHNRGFAYRRFVAARLPALVFTKLGLHDEQRFRDRIIAELPKLLRGRNRDEVASMAEWVVEHELWPRCDDA